MVAAVRSAATFLIVSLYIAIVGPPVLLISLLFGSRSLLFKAGHIGVRLGLILSGLKASVSGAEFIQHQRAAVYAINHSSNVEPPIIFDVLHGLFPRLAVLYKAELRKLPILVRAFDLAGFVPLERGNRDQSLPAIDRAADSLKSGNSFLIFPEGTRSRTGELLPFKKGGFIMAIKGQAPVVPVAIAGTRDAMHKGSFIIHPTTVRVRLGQPIETAGMTLEDRDWLVQQVRTSVADLLASIS